MKAHRFVVPFVVLIISFTAQGSLLERYRDWRYPGVSGVYREQIDTIEAYAVPDADRAAMKRAKRAALEALRRGDIATAHHIINHDLKCAAKIGSHDYRSFWCDKQRGSAATVTAP